MRQPPASPGRGIALLIIDVQRGLFERAAPIHQSELLLRNINFLAARARRAGAPVVYVQHSGRRSLLRGSDAWQLHPRLQPRGTDRVVCKEHGDAFRDTTLDRELRSSGVSRVAVTGLMTHQCVKATCVGAARHGYEVVLIRDGHSNYCRNAARVIADWNRRLGAGTVQLRSTAEMEFDKCSPGEHGEFVFKVRGPVESDEASGRSVSRRRLPSSDG